MGCAVTAAITPALTSLAAEPFNAGPSAQMYGSLAAVLAGFAFAGLLLYLERQRPTGPNGMTPLKPVQDNGYTHIRPRDVVTTLFFAMSALTISAFLYGRLTGVSDASGRTFLILGLYGAVLAPAVLCLFYALNLAMLTHQATRETAERTRWVVVAVGPAVVMALLADILAYAWGHGCQGGCSSWTSPRLWGFVLSAGFVIFGLFLTSLTVRRFRPLRIPLGWILSRRWIRACAIIFRDRAHYPAFMTLTLAAVVAITSVWARGVPESVNPRHWTHAVLGCAALVMGVFAFAAGSVLDKVPTSVECRRSDE